MTVPVLLAVLIAGFGCASNSGVVPPFIPEGEACFFIPEGEEIGDQETKYPGYFVEETLYRQLVEKATGQPITVEK